MNTPKIVTQHSLVLLCSLGLAACLPPKSEPGSEGPQASTDTGAGPQTAPTTTGPQTTAPEVMGLETTAPETTGSETTATETSGSETTGPEAPGDDTDIGLTESADHPLDPECTAKAVNFYDWDAWHAAQALLDLDSLEQVSCPGVGQNDCGDGPISGMKSALAVRNDHLPAPREFVPPDTRWLVWSNRELGCDDPFGAPLCAGEWRVAWAVPFQYWCVQLRHYDFFNSFMEEFGAQFLFEWGDPECQTHTGVIQKGDDDGLQIVQLHFKPMTLPPEAPQPGELCNTCQIPGVDAQVAGDFAAEICP